MANIVFRVDGGRTVGMGHIVRCLALAGVLRESRSCTVSFCMNQDEVGLAYLPGLGWPVRQIAANEMRFRSAVEAVDGRIADGVIVDLPNGVSAEFVQEARSSNPGAVILLMDGTCSGRLEADLVVAPIERLPQASAWTGFRGERYEGPAHAILDPAYATAPKRGTVIAQPPRVLVTMGGSDPYGLTLQALRALDTMPEPFVIVIAAGPAFMHEDALAVWRGTARHGYEIKRENSLLEAMVSADVAVVSFGTTVYELAATGLPAVALSITDDHWQAAEVFARYGSMISLGLYSSVEDAVIQGAVRRLLNDRALWLGMAQRGQSTIDGLGAERVAKLLLSKIHERRTSRAEGEVGTSQRG